MNKPEYINIIPGRTKKNIVTVQYKGKFLHSQYNPLKEAEIEISRYKNIENKNIIFILGAGLGYILYPLLKKINKNCKIIIIEKENYFKDYIKKNFSNYLNLIKFINTDEEIENLILNLKEIELDNILFIENKILLSIEKEYYQRIKNKILSLLKNYIANITTTAYFSKIWLKNILLNTANISEKISLINYYKDTFTNETVLFISASPFVEENIKFIRNFKGYIFALAPAVNYLIKNNISPHFIITTDSNFSNLYHLLPFLHNKKLTLITDLSIHPVVFKNWKSKIILIDLNFPPTQIFKLTYGEIGYIPEGGTVASSALFIFKYLGIKNIILIGQDFKYMGFKTHITGSGYDNFYLLRNNKYNTLINYNFNIIINNKLKKLKNFQTTDSKMDMYKNWFLKTLNTLSDNINFIYNLKSVPNNIEKKNKFIFSPLKTNSIKLKNIVKNYYQKIEYIDINVNIDSLLEIINKDIIIYNLFTMAMYQEFLQYKKRIISEEEFIKKFSKNKKYILNLLSYILKSI